MLIRFRFENHLSFRDETELSLVASNALADPDDCLIPTEVSDVSLLPSVGIYGPNASGKTNLFSALNFMCWAVRVSHRKWEADGGIPRSPFALHDGSSEAPSIFEMDFLLDEIRYQFGFEVDSDKVIREWLYSYPKGRRRTLFVRDISEEDTFYFGKHLKGENATIASLTRSNSLFLSAAAQSNHEQLMAVYTWFTGSVRSASSSDFNQRLNFTLHLLEEHPDLADMDDLLRAADLGIVGVETKKLAPEVEERLKEVRSALAPILELEEDQEIEYPGSARVSFRHEARGSEAGVPLAFEDESQGTQNLFSLLGPVIWALGKGHLLLVDDFDAGLHPVLARGLVEKFCDPSVNRHGAQLVFNTHDTNLLSSDILRRDQVCFTEKDSEGASHLYPLTDFKPRKGEDLERGYLQGRYGAVPVLSSRRFLTGVGQ